MRLLIFVVVLLTLLNVSANGQVVLFGIGGDVTFPTSELKNSVATGYGGTGLVKFGLFPIVDLTGGLEFIKFTNKDINAANGTETGTGSAVGVLVGGRVSFLAIGYVGAEVGTYSYFRKVGSEESDITRGVFAPMLGAKLGRFDICARYVAASDDSFWGLGGMIWF
jgi:hypothetical protein